MSTLPGQASKAEKTKSKFQSLDINSLYRVSRGENLEKQQQKSSSVYIKHGMQSLGKVPNARRAPANLPSLKAEHSGSDAAVPLVPPGAQGWGKQDASAAAPQATAAATAPAQSPSQSTTAAVAGVGQTPPQGAAQMSPHQAAIALPVTNPVPHPHKQLTPSAQPAPVDKLWSSVMSGQDVPHPPLYHSPQFQHEFPSLSAGDGGPTRTGSDAPQYPSGLSLRPQTEGSWTQGGTSPATGGDPAGPGRPNSVPPGAQTQPSAQGGQQPFPPQMRGVMPSFMYKGSGFQQQQAPGVGGQGAPPTNGRAHHRGGADGRPPRPGGPEREAEEAVPRPIIKEEELTRMDEIGKDMGWAESDEIDYNQKLAFSDDETDRGAKKDNAKRRPTGGRSDPKEERPVDPHPADGGQPQPRQRGGPRSGAAPRSARPAEEEDVWTQRRNQTDKEVELAVQRAKQRKEEEEKRFQEERKQAAAKKLMELEEKIQKRDRDISHEAPPEKEVDGEDKGGSSFRQLTQIEGKNFPQRKHAKPEGGRESGAPFSKNFQNDLPPRFLKHQRGNNNNNSSGQQQQQPQHQFDSRWSSQNAPKHQQQEHQQPAGNEKAAAAADRGKDKEEDTNTRRQAKEKPAPASDWGEQRRDKGREREDWSDHRNKERDRRDFLSAWSEPPSAYEHVGEEQRRREDRRAVPGPITRERVEAEDARGGGEKRGLTQLRRGQPVEVRSEIAKRPTEGAVEQPAAWADSIPAAIEEQAKKLAEATAEAQQQQKVAVAAEPAKKQQQQEKAAPSEDYNRGKPSYGQKKGWGGSSASGGGGGSDYHPPRGGQPWPGRGQHGRGRRGGGNDSDGSLDDRGENKAETVDHRQRSPKSTRRNDGGGKFGGGGGKPAERQRENYVPRGEPSRHGRGGGNFRSGRMASMGKKIDGYGPPPAKSPFGGGHHPFDDKERRTEGATAAVEGAATATPSTATVEDKIKQNQQALAAGIIGKRADTDGGGNKAAAPRPAKPEPRKNGNNKPNNEVDDAARRPPVQGGKVPSGGGRPAPAPNRGGRGEKPNSKQSSDATPSEDGKSEGGAAVGDSEGFQEVKSKKAAVKERQKSSEDKPRAAAAPKNDATTPASAAPKDSRLGDRERGKSGKPQLTPQQIQNIPPLMATPVNPPPMLPKGGFDRGRQTSKLPPRFAKQKLQKQAMQQQQQQHLCGDLISDLSKGGGAFPAPPPTCAWDKPLGSQLREAAPVIGDVKAPEAADKPLLDGSSAPVNTIIFENTNFKSAPGARPKSDDANGHMDGSGFGKPPHELLQQQQQGKVGEGKAAEAASMHLPLFKADAADMKIDFFSADLQFGDDKASKNFVAKSIHAITSGNNTVDSLDIKIASVKKVWDTSEQEGEDHQLSFGGPPLDSNVFGQGKDTSVEDGHDGPNQSAQTNVCKVKPTQQVSGGGQSAMGSAHQPHAGLVAAGLMGNPLSPPPIPPQLGAAGVGVGMGPQYTANQHMGYQTGLSGSTQYGISAIPSPPAVPLVYNSSQQQQLQSAVQTAAGLYGAFQLDHQLGGQGRSQFSQYAGYHGLGQTATSPYSTPSVYLPTPPHPPPPAAQPPPPELYQNIGNFRLSATTPFGQSQQLSNPSTVLISSTSNSLMSASVKPSGQQISAIGTKAGGVGQAYQQQSQQGQQVYMTYDPSMQANYLASNAGVMQRPTQNNVVPGLQPSSSYYSGSTGGQTGFFQQPGNSAQMSQHQAGYGLQGNVFGTHNQSHTNNALQNYNSHFLTAPMQVAAALSAQQQFRSNLPAAAYMKGVGDQSGRSQQLKSPSSQEVLSSVFNSGPQIPSPKSRQNMKHPPQQSSPTSQHKYNMYQQGVGGPPPNMNMQRYPTPIQRPINFQQMQQNSVNQKHRNNPNSNKPSNNRYYGNQNHSLSSQSEKCDDAKIDGGANATGAAKSAATGADVVKDNLKEETVALKD